MELDDRTKSEHDSQIREVNVDATAASGHNALKVNNSQSASY